MQSLTEMKKKVFAAPCEKRFSCDYATAKCFEAVPYNPETWRTIPARRWIDCYGWKKTLKMFLDKKSGSYVYLSEQTRNMLDKLKLVPSESYDEVVRRLLSEV